MIACNAMDIMNVYWRQAEAWLMVFIGAVEVKALLKERYRKAHSSRGLSTKLLI